MAFNEAEPHVQKNSHTGKNVVTKNPNKKGKQYSSTYQLFIRNIQHAIMAISSPSSQGLILP